ncbi:MAG: hypothetical protein KJO25_07470 [Bacteroidia bacterium]|nr:hypothetical protein [Bacteroidia bacterium]
MRFLCFLSAVLLSPIFMYAQEDSAIFGAPTNNLGLRGVNESQVLANTLDWNKIEGVFYQFDDIRFGKVPTDGSFLLFESWNNKGVLHIGAERLVINNINFHVDEEKFISEMDNDSTFVYDFKGIDRIVVKDRAFVSMYSSKVGKNKVYEVVAESEDLSLLKNYYSDVSTGSPNPMLNRSRNKIRLKSNYFLLKNGGMIPFKLKKSGLRTVLPPDKAEKLEKYAKEKRLSYKKDEDLKKIFKYLRNL